MTEPTDEPSGEWLDNNIYGPIILAPHAEEHSHLDGLVAVYLAGVASQAARIAELEAERDKAQENYQFMVYRAANELDGYRELAQRCATLEAERDTLTRDKSTLASRLKDVRDILCDFDEPHRSGDEVGIRQVASKAATEVLRLRTDKAAMLAKVEAQRVELSEALAAVAELDSTVDTLTRELAEAREELRLLAAFEPMRPVYPHVADRGVRFSGAGGRVGTDSHVDDGPPREAKAPEFLEVEHPANAMAAKALAAEGVRVNRHPKEFVSEAQTGELAAKTGGLAGQTGGLPGGPGPNTDRIAELERKVAALWHEHVHASGSENP